MIKEKSRIDSTDEKLENILLDAHDVQEGAKRGPQSTEGLSPAETEGGKMMKDSKTGVLDIDDVPDSVPHRRYPQPLTQFSYHPYYINWKQGKWAIAKDQTCGIDLSVFVEVYYAANIESKIVRLTVFGSGFSTGAIRQNNWLERGVFQDKLNLTIGPVNSKALHMGENSPKTENSEAAFTSTAATTIKVSGSAGGGKGGQGGGEASYSVSSSVSTKISDFSVLNYSDGTNGKWQWELTKMGAGDPKYTYPYDGPKSLVNFWGNIIPVPGLSRSTLFPACQAYWYAPLNFNDIVEFEVAASQRQAYVVSNNIKFYAANSPAVNRKWRFKVAFNLDAAKLGAGLDGGVKRSRYRSPWAILTYIIAAFSLLFLTTNRMKREQD